MKYWVFFLAAIVAIVISSCCTPCEEEEDCEEEVEEATCSVYIYSFTAGGNEYNSLCIRGVPEACVATFYSQPTAWYTVSHCNEDENPHCIGLYGGRRAVIYDDMRRTIDLSSCEFHPPDMVWWEEGEVYIDLTP